MSLGEPVTNWSGAPHPPYEPRDGTHCRLVPFTTEHAAALRAAWTDDGFTYLPQDPFRTDADVTAFYDGLKADGIQPYTVTVNGTPRGVMTYLRINPPHGTIEIGHIHFGQGLAGTAASTEACYLLAARAFDLGYRRLEWKCNAGNAASRRAAERLGFTYEGTHRHAMVIKGRNRDSAWFSILDHEWPDRRARLLRWLSPDNFDADGRQRAPLT